ncbi:hypothetical protein ABLT31_36490 [Ammoniphilus sp. 3BR4]
MGVLSRGVSKAFKKQSESVEEMTPTEAEELFRLLLKETQHPCLKGWSDWQLSLLESASRLAINADMAREWDRYASQMTAREEQGTWSGGYVSERIAMLRYRFIQEKESPEQEKEYVKQHLHLPSFRKIAIQQALDQGRFEEAIQLAQEGEEQDKANGWRGLVKQWKELRYEAYRASGQLEQQRSLGEELALDGDYSYYQRIKNTYLPSEWPPVYQRILEKLEQDRWPGQIYTQILIEEQETARLLEFVKRQPARVEEFYSTLVKEFPKETKELFQIHIENTANQSSTRRDYQNVCRIIQMLNRAGGQAEADQAIRLLLAKYPRRPAFREELLKLENSFRVNRS